MQINKVSEELGNSDGKDTWRQNKRESQWYIAWRMCRRDKMSMFGLVGLLLLILMSLLAPILAPYNPTAVNVDSLMEPPNRTHLFGTDDLGRDIFSRMLWGGRESLSVALMGVAIAFTAGTFIGLISGYYGGLIDIVIQRFVDITLALPYILLLLSIVSALGPSLGTVLFALGLASIPIFIRMVRGIVLSTKNNEFVEAAQVIGATNWRIMVYHILPNCIPSVIVYSALYLGNAIILTAGMSYIGLGAQPPSPEWGAMLNYGRSFIRDAWWMSVFPGLVICLAVLFINLLGDGLRDALDPKLRV